MSIPQMQPGGLMMPGAPRPKHHPFANLFPMLADDRRESFRDSLKENQNHPIVLHKGLILDGRNRERELAELGKPVKFVVFVGTDRQALDFVKAENLERRDLTESQRALIGAKIATLRLGDNQHSAQPAPIGAPSLFSNEAASDASGEAEEQRPSISQADAADMMNVGRRSVQRATVVLEKGAPELVEAVEKGAVAVSAAADIAALPIEEQKAIIAAADPKVVKEVAKKNRSEKQAAGRERRLENMRKPDATPLLAGGNKVGVFYIDIPRKFTSWSDDTGAEKSPENHYRVETFEFLAGLRDEIQARAKDDAVVFMWAWANSLQDQIDLLAEWGFASVRRRDDVGRLLRGTDGKILKPVGEGRYRSHQIWAKRASTGNYNRGTGFWFIDCHELLLVGARGDVPAPTMGTQAMSILDGEIGDHSEKPAAFRDQIDRYFPGVPKLEMFGRVDDEAAFKAKYPLWDVWGNEMFGADQPRSEDAA
ncbi:MAG: MT-A70 family methyltransferase [bacterium]|nr:MT-A70 family methyltransferase [bacterium]